MKVGILGAGAMGGSVIKAIRDEPGVDEIVALDIRPERVRQLREELGVTATDSPAAVLDDPEVKLVFVTASNAAHAPLTLAALEAGKAVMCEKPIATTLADAERVVRTAEAKGAFLQIGFELRYSKLYTQVKNWIDQGLLGDVVNTQCNYICEEFHKKGSWRNRLETGGGMFGEKLSHYVDLPRWWVGSPVKDVFAVCAPNVVPYYEVHDNYHAVYRFVNGAVSELTFVMYMAQTYQGDPLKDFVATQSRDGHELRYRIIGTRGAAETDVFNRRVRRWEFGDAPERMISTLVEEATWTREEDSRHFHNEDGQNRDIVRRVLAGEPPATPARDALETMRLVFAAEQSADSGELVRV
jgi:predicted dehydrogenase